MRTAFRLLMAVLKSILIDHSTPVTVTPNAYDTSGNGGRKLIIHTSGNLYTVLRTSTDWYIYKSSDKGATWSQWKTGNSTSIQDICLASDSTSVFFMLLINNSAAYVQTYTESDGTLRYNTAIDTGQTSLDKCSMTIDSTGTYLHTTWSSKNATYPNSFNIRYAKGTINGDGSVTWGSVEQVVNANASGYDYTNPVVVLRNNGNPSIVCQLATSQNKIHIFNKTSTWAGTIVTVHDGGTYAQSSPDAIVDKNGVLWCSWHGLDATDTTYYNIRCKYSTDGGVTWVNANGSTEKLTSGNSYHQVSTSITHDSNNNIYILFVGKSVSSPSINQLRKIIYSSGVWGTIVDLTTNTSNAIESPASCNNFLNFTDPICIYRDNQAGAVKFRGVWTETP